MLLGDPRTYPESLPAPQGKSGLAFPNDANEALIPLHPRLLGLRF